MTTKAEDETAILKTHEKLVGHMAKAFAGGRASKDDLMQEGRIALLDAARRYRADEGARLWTYARVFVFAAIERFARGEREQAAGGAEYDDAAYRTIDDRANPEEALEARQCSQIVEAQFASLEDAERQALALRFVEELDVRSIGRTLGVPRSTASDLIQGAISKLGDNLEASL